jgi:hypothetical protein
LKNEEGNYITPIKVTQLSSTPRTSIKKNRVFDEKTKAVEYEVSLQLDFPVQNYFMLGSPVGMFCSVYSEEAFVRSQLPTCKRFYNIYHPSDLVAYRIEPLIKQYSYDKQVELLTPQNKYLNPEDHESSDSGADTHRRLLGHKADKTKTVV